MRILFINKYHFLKGGAERAVFDTADILAEKGHEVIYFAMDHPNNKPTPWSRYFVPQVDYSDENVSWYKKIERAVNIVWNRNAARNLEALLKEVRPDIAHIHNIYHQISPSVLWTLKKYRIPIVMTLHDYKLASPNYNLFVRGKIWEHGSGFRCLIDRCVKESFLKSAVCVLEQWIHRFIGSYSLVDRFIAPSQFLIDTMRRLGFSQEIEKVAQPLRPFPAPAFTHQGNSLLFFGRLSQEKGVSFLLEAMSGLPNEKLLIIGTGPEEAHLKQKKNDMNLTNVEFLGPKYYEELGKFIEEARAVIIPSLWYENMPYAMLEAMGAGKIVIASRLGGIPERIESGHNGYLFEPGSIQSFKEVISDLNSLEEKQKKALERAAYESVKDLQPHVYGDRLETLYTRLILSGKTAGNPKIKH